MTYKQIAAEFFFGCFQAALCVELFICKLLRDSFGWASKKFEFLCQDGMNQMARLRNEPGGVVEKPIAPARAWSARGSNWPGLLAKHS